MATFRDFAKENSDGWSLLAVQAKIEAVAEVLRNVDSVTTYSDNVAVGVMANSRDEDGNIISFTPSPTDRTCFAVSARRSKWCIVFRTLYWCESADKEWVNETAKSLSESLNCEAIASCATGHGFSTCIYKDGNLEAKLPGRDRSIVVKEFTSRKVRPPICFVGGSPASLYAQRDSMAEIERADKFECRITMP